MINARQLEVLCAVIEVGTTARAAALLNVSQPAVSNMIRHTEDMVGFPLFLRERGRLVPTPEALHIAHEAQHLFRQQKRVGNIIDELRDGTLGRLSIIATPSLGQGLLPQILAGFTGSRPKMNLSFELGSIDEIVNSLVSGQMDLGLSIAAPRHSALSVQPVAQGHMVLLCPEGHELALNERTRITDLNHVNHISYAAGTPIGRAIDEVFSKEGLERRYFCEVRHTATAINLVRAGMGVALVDNFALLGQKIDGVVARPTHPVLPLTVNAITSSHFPTPNLALKFQRYFSDFVSARAEALPMK